MQTKGILKILEETVAPLKVSHDLCAKYGMYDNSGIILDSGKDVDGILFTLDLSRASIKTAKDKGCNLIVTHHPAIFGGILHISAFGSAQERAIAECIKSGISVISMHLNFDAAPKGIDYYLMRGLGGDREDDVLDKVEGGAYGRVYDTPRQPLALYLEHIEKEFKTQRIVVYCECNQTVSTVASFCGAGLDDSAVAFAKKKNVDAVVSSDMPHHRIAELVESGIAVIQLTHYCIESYGFEKIYEDIKAKLPVPSAFFRDGRFV